MRSIAVQVLVKVRCARRPSNTRPGYFPDFFVEELVWPSLETFSPEALGSAFPVPIDFMS